MPKPLRTHLYGTQRWKNRRAKQLRNHPLCAMCKADGRTTAATVADHEEPHRNDEALFWNGKLQSLCARHHDSDRKRIEAGTQRKQMGVEGWPIE